MRSKEEEMSNDGKEQPANAQNAEDSWVYWQKLTAEAYSIFQDILRSKKSIHPELTGYTTAERVQATQGTFPWMWGASGEIQETINSANAWGSRLHEWGAWNFVIDSYESEDEKWEILNHFVEPIAFYCMLQPSSFSDRIVLASETILHQANIRVIPGYIDELDQDKTGRSLRRSDRLKQLKRLGKSWSKFEEFRISVEQINGEQYKDLTKNFRDLSAHSFAPKLMIGQIIRSIRSTTQKTKLVKTPDGTFILENVPEERSISYAMHAIEPLPLQSTYHANLAEYKKAKTSLQAFFELINEMCDRIDEISGKEKG